MTSREHDRNAPYEKNKYLSFLKYICIYLFIYTFSYIIIPSLSLQISIECWELKNRERIILMPQTYLSCKVRDK